MRIDEILKNTSYSLSIFEPKEKKWLEERIIEEDGKKGKEYKVECIIRGKIIKLYPEEVVRQLYTYKLISKYDYPEKLIQFEYPIKFGREAKRADIVILDKNDNSAAYIINSSCDL